MSSRSQAKTLGGVGSILVLLTPIPTVGWLLGIVGFVMTLIAVKNISDSVGDSSIFTNMIISVILAIVGVVIGGLVVAGAIIGMMGLGGFMGNPGAIPVTSGLFAAIGTLILGLAVIWIVFIISAFFLRKAYNAISTKLGVGMFHTAALLYFIGSILIILLGLGFLLILVAQILLAVAYFSIPEGGGPMLQEPYHATYSPPPPPPTYPTSSSSPAGAAPAASAQSSGAKFCFKCGAELAPGATFCPKCGEKQ